MQQPAARQFSGIFICYRRDDSAGHAGRLYDRLSAHFGEGNVFMDVDYIKPGEDYEQIIEKAVGSCEILLTLIGKRWLSSSDGALRRLDKPDDFVRLEIAAALDRGIRVIPILVQGASVPEPHVLPEDLARLSRRQAYELSDVRWKQDLDKLIIALERILDESQGARLRAARAEEALKRLRREAEEEQRRQAEEAARREQEAREAERRRGEVEAAEARRREKEIEELKRRAAADEDVTLISVRRRLTPDAVAADGTWDAIEPKAVERQRGAGRGAAHARAQGDHTPPLFSPANAPAVPLPASAPRPPQSRQSHLMLVAALAFCFFGVMMSLTIIERDANYSDTNSAATAAPASEQAEAHPNSQAEQNVAPEFSATTQTRPAGNPLPGTATKSFAGAGTPADAGKPTPQKQAAQARTAAEHFTRGEQLWSSSRQQAVAEFLAAADKGSADAYYYLGLAMLQGRDLSSLQRGDLETALQYFKEARRGSRFRAEARRYEDQLGREFDRRRQ